MLAGQQIRQRGRYHRAGIRALTSRGNRVHERTGDVAPIARGCELCEGGRITQQSLEERLAIFAARVSESVLDHTAAAAVACEAQRILDECLNHGSLLFWGAELEDVLDNVVAVAMAAQGGRLHQDLIDEVPGLRMRAVLQQAANRAASH